LTSAWAPLPARPAGAEGASASDAGEFVLAQTDDKQIAVEGAVASGGLGKRTERNCAL